MPGQSGTSARGKTRLNHAKTHHTSTLSSRISTEELKALLTQILHEIGKRNPHYKHNWREPLPKQAERAAAELRRVSEEPDAET